MRINIKRLADAGFDVQTINGEIVIGKRGWSETDQKAHEKLTAAIKGLVSDASLAEYVLGAAVIAVERAQILAVCE